MVEEGWKVTEKGDAALNKELARPGDRWSSEAELLGVCFLCDLPWQIIPLSDGTSVFDRFP